MLRGVLAGTFAAISILCAARADAAPAIGVLVDGPAGVRLAFAKAGDEWQPACAYPSDQSKPWTCANAPTQWFVRYRGRQIGVVSAKGWVDARAESALGLAKIVSSAPPHVGARDKIFAGWNDKPIYRPLVATNAAVPDRAADWQPAKTEAGDAAAAVPILQKHVGNVPDCEKDGEPNGAGTPIQTNDVRVFDVRQGPDGARIFGAALKPSLVAKCDYTADSLADVWLIADATGTRALPALAEDEATHAFVDAGDFAGDGGEEVLFALAGYNEDGFVLYYDRFRKAAKFAWSYH